MQLNPDLLKRIGSTWWKGESRGLQSEKLGAKAQPVFSAWVSVEESHIFLCGLMHGVPRRGIESGLLDGILSTFWQSCLNCPTGAFPLLMASPPIQSAVCVLSHTGFCSPVRLSPRLRTVADSQGRAANPYLSRFIFKCTKWTFSNGAVFLL